MSAHNVIISKSSHQPGQNGVIFILPCWYGIYETW